MSHAPDPGLLRRAAADPVISGNSLAVASMLFWAAGFPAAEILLQSWPPVALMVARLAMALSVLIPLWWLSDGADALRTARWGRALVVGGLGFGIGTYLLLMAQWFTDPVTVALIASCTPISATLIELAYRQRRLTPGFVLGMLATVLGGIVATGGQQVPGLGLGLTCAVASSLLFCWGGFTAVRDFPDLTPVGRSAITFTGAFFMVNLLFIGHAFAGLPVTPAIPVDAHQISMLAIYAIAAMALSQIMFIASIGRLGIAITTFHVNAVPFYVMLMMLALGASWSWPHAIGAVIVCAGVFLSQRG